MATTIGDFAPTGGRAPMKRQTTLSEAVAAVERLFLLQGEPGADVLRIIDLRRKQLRARDGHLDALWEAAQAQADLAAAVGDPVLAVAPCPPPPSCGPPRATISLEEEP
jgi:hypothetical protein